MKMIICARRNPALSRPEFFHHLRHVHWPMVRDFPTVAAAIGGYVQNHALGPDSPAAEFAPCRIATERDSVIELFFDGEEGLGRLVAEPDYLAHVRPDEGRFNDLPENIMVKTTTEIVFAAPIQGRCKRFDFLVGAPRTTAETVRADLAASGAALALDPAYTGLIDRHVHNWPLHADEGKGRQGFGSGRFDCVREVWAGSFEALQSTAQHFHERESIDAEQSFSVFATEFVMIG